MFFGLDFKIDRTSLVIIGPTGDLCVYISLSGYVSVRVCVRLYIRVGVTLCVNTCDCFSVYI